MPHTSLPIAIVKPWSPADRQPSPFRIAAGYFVAGLIWIWISDGALHLSGAQTATGFLLAAGKGSLFFLVTAPALYWLVRRDLLVITRANALLSAVTEGTTDAVFVKDKSGRYLLFNSAASKLVGKPVTDVLGRDDSAFFDPESVRRVKAADQNVMQSGSVVTAEERLTAAGIERIYSATKAPLHDDHGSIVGVIGISRDITERVRAEAQIRDREQLLAVVTSAARVGLVVVGSGYVYLFANQAYAEVLGLPAGHIVGRRVPDLLKDGWEQVRPRLDLALAGERQQYDLTLPPLENGKHDRHYRVMYEPRSDLNGRVTVVVVVVDISDYRRTEAELRAERDRFEKLVESSPAVIYSFQLKTDGTMCVPYASRMIEEIFGIPRERLTTDASPIFSMTHPDDVEVIRQSIDSSAKNLSVWHGEFRINHPTRGEVWAEGRSAPIRRADGSTVWHGFIADVTERKQHANEIAQARSILRQVIDTVPYGVFWKDRQSKHLGCNITVARALGFNTPEEVVGRADTDLPGVTPEEANQFMQVDQEVIRSGISRLRVSEFMTHTDGTIVWLETNKFPLRSAAGHIIGIIGTWEDVTERKKTEEALRESEWRFRQVFENAATGITITDVDGRFLQCNPTYCAVHGLTEEEMKVAELAKMIHPEDRDENMTLLRKLAAGEIPRYELENRFLHKSGEPRWVHKWVTSFTGESGQAKYLLALVTDVTERRRAEQELRASEERLRLAIQATNIGMWDLNMTNDRTLYSPEWKTQLGYSGDEIRDTFDEWNSRVHPDDIVPLLEYVSRQLDSKEDSLEAEYRMRHKDGTWRWIFSRAVVFRNPENVPVRMLGGNIDVTHRRQSEEAVKASEARYRRLVEVLPEAIFINSNDRVTYCNPACVALFGATDDSAIVGQSPLKLFAPEYHQLIRDRIQKMRETGASAPGLDERIVRADGRSTLAHVVATPITDDGRDAILVCLHDLSERERTHQLLRTVLGSVSDAILTIDANGRVESANPATQRLFAYTDTELIGQNVRMLMPEPDRRNHDTYITNYIQSGNPKVIGFGREVICRRKDGSTFPAELTVTEFRQDGERRFTGVLRDITSRRKLEDQFRQSQKMEAIGRLAGGVAHDFNNLLTVINGYCDLLLLNLPAEDSNRSFISSVRDAGERAASLTSQLLAFSRKAIVAPKVFDLKDVAVQSEKILRRLIGEDIVLTLILHSAPCPVKADPGQIDQVIMNLAVNARDAMPTGGRLTLETRLVNVAENETAVLGSGLRPGQYVELAMTDTGSGMTPEIQARIFEPFFTTKGEGQGTGLGLATVFGIVHQAGGHIGVESEVGHGTTFRVLLPYVEGLAKAAEKVRPAVARGKEVVLLVEDDVAVRQLSRLALETQGYQVLVAAGGQEALDHLQTASSQVDIVVTDVVMPEMSGRQLADSVRVKYPGMKVLFVSGYTDDAVVRHGVRDASDAFLQKPFTPFGLARKVREVLDAK